MRVGNRFRRQSRGFSLNDEVFHKRHGSAVGRSGNPVVVFVCPFQGNRTARAIPAAADSRAIVAALRRDRAAVDGNRTARAIPAAADSRAIVAALRRDRAAINGNHAARAAVAAANSSAFVAALRRDRAAVDGNRTARATVAAADSSAEPVARCRDRAAVNGNYAAAADSRRTITIAACRREFAHIVARGLGVDGQAGAAADVNAADSKPLSKILIVGRT